MAEGATSTGSRQVCDEGRSPVIATMASVQVVQALAQAPLNFPTQVQEGCRSGDALSSKR